MYLIKNINFIGCWGFVNVFFIKWIKLEKPNIVAPPLRDTCHPSCSTMYYTVISLISSRASWLTQDSHVMHCPSSVDHISVTYYPCTHGCCVLTVLIHFSLIMTCGIVSMCSFSIIQRSRFNLSQKLNFFQYKYLNITPLNEDINVITQILRENLDLM